MRLWILRTSSLLLAAFTLVACPKLEDLPQSNLSCLLTLADGTESPVPSGEAVELTVTAMGGTAPYKLLGVIGTFEDSASVSRTYNNETDEVVSQEDSAIIFDSHGFSTQCFVSFDVDVADDDTDPSTDPEISLEVTPSASVVKTTNIIVVASSDGFDGEPVTYTFDFDETGVQLGQDMNVATFSVTDDGAHSFTVTVTAESASEEVSTTVDLEFTDIPVTSIPCTLEKEEGPYVTGEEINFFLETTGSDELEITSFQYGSNANGTFNTDGSVDVTYNSAGAKYVYVTGRSKDTGALCNGGGVMADAFFVEEPPQPLSCTARTQYNQYYIYRQYGAEYITAPYSEQIWAWVTVPSGVADGQVTVTGVSSSANGYFNLYANDYPRYAEVYLNETGFFTLTLSIEDESGATASCTTPYFWVDNWYYY